MPEQEPQPADLIEWGNPPAGPDMIPPTPPVEPVAAPAAVQPEVGAPVPRPGPVALSLLAIGFGLAIAAQYLPWSSISTGFTNQQDDSFVAPRRQLPESIEIDLVSLNTGHVVTYLTTIVLALVSIAVLLATGGVVRRAASAAAGGLLAGNLLVLVGLKSSVDDLGVSPDTAYLLPRDAASIGAGYPLAFAAALLLGVGVVVAVRSPLVGRRMSRRKAEEQFDGGEAVDITVTAVPPNRFPMTGSH